MRRVAAVALLTAALLASCRWDPVSPGPRPDYSARPAGTAAGVRLLEPSEDTSRLSSVPGSYEWWNFFAADDSGALTVSAIFLSGNLWDIEYRKLVHDHRSDPGSSPPPDPSDYPLLQVNVVHHGRKVFTTVALPPGATTDFATSGLPAGRIGRSIFSAASDGTWRVHLDHPDMMNWLHISADLEFRPGAPAFTVGGGGMWGPIPGGDLHQWQFPVSLPTTSGHLRITNRFGAVVLDARIEGGGYTDHIWGEGLNDDVQVAWHFGQAWLGGADGTFAWVWFTPRDPAVPEYGRLIRLRPGAEPDVLVITDFEKAGARKGKSGLAYHDDLALGVDGGGTVRVRWKGNVEDWPFQVAGDAVYDIDLPGDVTRSGVPGGAEYAWHPGIDDPVFRLLSSALEDIPRLP